MTNLNEIELETVAGGVTEGPNGEGCTSSAVPRLTINGVDLLGGPLFVGRLGGSKH